MRLSSATVNGLRRRCSDSLTATTARATRKRWRSVSFAPSPTTYRSGRSTDEESLSVLQHCAKTLEDFNGGQSCIQIYVNQHDFFISKERVQETAGGLVGGAM